MWRLFVTTECFLCDPAPSLTIGTVGKLRVIAGLGPLTATYLVIGTIEHSSSFADAIEADPNIAKTLQDVRSWLTDEVGEFTIAEHGRIPVCDDDDHTALSHDAHCYHAHCLCFQTTNDIDSLATTYFARSDQSQTLQESYFAAKSVGSYVLVSPTPSRFTIYSQPLNLPRQLVRSLVAHTLGALELADWRRFPERAIADSTASRLRASFEGRFSDGR